MATKEGVTAAMILEDNVIPGEATRRIAGVIAAVPRRIRENYRMKRILGSGVAFLASLVIAGAAQAQVKVGVAGPFTGPNASFGAQLKQGAEVAAAELNAKGGLNGKQIQLVFGDDASDPKQGVSVANKMVGDGVKLVIGHFNSGVTIPASLVYAEHGILMVTPSATNPVITERKMWNVFRTCGRDDQQSEVAGKFIASKFKGKRVAIAHDKTPYGKGLADETKKAMNKAGITEVLYEGVNTGEKDLSAVVGKIKTSRADLVYWGGLHTEGGLLIRQMRDAGLKTVAMSGDGIVSSEFVQIAGPGVEGTLMTFAPDPRKRPEAAAIVKRFVTERKFDPEAYTLYSYAALQIIAAAAAETKGLDTKKMAAAMRGGKAYNTVIGPIAYNKKGDITRADYVMYTWKKQADGKITYIQN